MLIAYLIVTAVITIGAVTAFKTGKLTGAAACAGWLIGVFIFAGIGYAGVCMLAAFFLLGTMATSWKLNTKQKLGLAENDKGKRTAGQVVANAGVAGLLCLFILIDPDHSFLCKLMAFASIAAATADTVSSELGNVYGRKFYNIVTLKKDERGLNGVISFEGTALGILGSAVIAAIYAVANGVDRNMFLIIAAGTVGNVTDSILGATLENKNRMNNNAVNFCNTLAGATAAAVLQLLLG